MTTPGLRRGGWALPPQPPETWIGGAWSVALSIAVLAAAAVPVAVLPGDVDGSTTAFAAANVLSGVSALLVAYVLLVQTSVTGDPVLRWVAGGYALVFVGVMARSLEVSGPQQAGKQSAVELAQGAGLSLLWGLAVPAFVLTVWLAQRSTWLMLLPAVVVTGVAVVLVATPQVLPELLRADLSFTAAARTLELALAGLALLALVVWVRTTPLRWGGPWGWVSVSLALAAGVGVVRSAATERWSDTWWASIGLECAALLIPALGLCLVTSAGYFRQARRWRQLEAEVRSLRAASTLLPGRSVTPEDEEGLPEEADVRDLVDSARVRIALQPVVELASGDVVGHEALSRMGGRMPTDRWFRAASRYGMGAALERVSLTAALALLPGLPEPGFLAVNISPAALSDPEVLALLHRAPLHRIVVEVTEHEAVADYPGARAELDRLRAAGARIAVDDTGAGFASLRHVLLLQPDVIKLDTSLIRDIEHDPRQRALVVALRDFARAVGTEVLAEGVETQAQVDALTDIGVRIGQGWHLGVPVTQP